MGKNRISTAKMRDQANLAGSGMASSRSDAYCIYECTSGDERHVDIQRLLYVGKAGRMRNRLNGEAPVCVLR